MKPTFSRQFWLGLIKKTLALAAAVVLFAGAFPNPFFRDGLPFLAWIAYVPVFYIVKNCSVPGSFLWGAVYGYSSYALFCYWASVFHPLAGVVINTIYLTYLLLVFPLLKAADRLYPRRGYIVQWMIWIAYEYFKTRGFVGYAYGITGYSQWSFIPLIQIAALTGVWGVSALVVFPSAYLGALVNAGKHGWRAFFIRERLPAIVWTVALAATLAYGLFGQVDYSDSPKKRIALVQNNADPWRGGIKAYRENFDVMKRLSDEALAAAPQPELVVWSETAFVPRIYWHTTYRDDSESWNLVKELLDYLAAAPVPFVFGNDDARLEVGDDGKYSQIDYNAVLVYDRGKEIGIYRKLHLVPFTEHFPYQKQLPLVYKALKDADTHFWKKGTVPTVFNAAGIKFSTPICFEDTFGYLSRRFVQNGAELIINLTNDAWANSLPSQMQHATMAIFRAVENRRSLVRSTASGQTCAIDPNGRVLAMAEPFIQTQITVDVPIYTKTISLYTRWGDYFAFGFIGAAALALAAGIGGVLMRRRPGFIDKRGNA
jgi:apolipoprotein N-acyltransferase